MSRLTEKLRVATADSELNDYLRDVVGSKSDAAAADAVTTTESLMAYVKQIVTAAVAPSLPVTVPTADAVTNAYSRDVVGNKTDAAAAGAVSEVETLMAYLKQVITLAIARDTAIGTLDTNVDSILADTGTNGVILEADAVTSAKIADNAYSEEHFDVDSSMKLILGEVVNKTATTLPQTTATAQFTVAGGRVLVTSIVGEVTVIIAGANATKLTATPTIGSAVDMCVALDIDADEVGCLYGLTGTPGDTLVGTDAGLTIGMSNNGIVVNAGTIDLDCAGNATGETKWTLHYVPIDIGATVVAA